MQLAIIGGGINGLCIAWQLLQQGHQVELFERDGLMQATSSASSKLLHGGIRYLEQGHLGLVRLSLAQRRFWLQRQPALTRPLPMLLPVYRDGPRSRFKLALGLSLYRALAGFDALSCWSWQSPRQLLAQIPNLNPEGLLGGFRFFEGQMDDRRLGLWVAQQVEALGGRLHLQQEVQRVALDGELTLTGGCRQFEGLINAAGPWSQKLLEQSGLTSGCQLQALRGSHLLLAGELAAGLVLPVPGSTRIFFVLPYQGQTLVGTTEVLQLLEAPIGCSPAERAELLAAYQQYLGPAPEVMASFAGIRPLIATDHHPSRASREHQIQRQGRLLSVFGGKWTTAPALALEVGQQVQQHWQ